MLSKKDIILAKKTFEANKYKFEAKNAGRVYTPSGVRSGGIMQQDPSENRRRPVSVQGGRLSSQQSQAQGTKQELGRTMSLTRLDEMEDDNELLPHINSNRPSTSMVTSPIKKNKGAHELTAEELIAELAQRGLTDTMIRKKQNLTVADKMRKKTATVDYMDPDFDHEAFQKEDYYMPKKVVTRPDGATLMDIYRSKQEDTWSQILKAQLRQEKVEKEVQKRRKEEANETYGRLLKEQLAANMRRDQAGDAEGERLAAVVEATSKAKDDEQKRRKTDAVERQKMFIQHALEDIETKRIKAEAELSNELEAAMKTNNKVRAAIANDELKKALNKEKEAKRLADLWDENQRELSRKAHLKQLEGEENLRIFKVGEEKYRLQDEKREADLAAKLRASSDGPAHSTTWEITRKFREREDEFYRQNEERGNMLNKQLLNSESEAAVRAKGQGALLLAEWDKNMAEKQRIAQSDAERNAKILEYQKAQKVKSDKDDEDKREAKRLAGLRYQRELDFQLGQSRERSKDALRKTMSDRERLYNSNLLLQTGLIHAKDELKVVH